MAHDCTRSCSGRTSSRCRRGSPSASLAVEVAGVLAAAAPLGMPSGKDAHHPGWKPLQGSANDRIPGWAPSPCRLPGPVPRYGAVFGTDFHRRCPRLKQAPLPSAKKGWGKPLPSQKVCAGQSSVRGNPVCRQDVRGSSLSWLFFLLVDQRCRM